MGKVICVNNNKGGVLKTTTVTNLAGVIASYRKKVLIIDADNQSNVSVAFGKNPDDFRTSLYDVLMGNVPAEDAIYSAHEFIDVLPSNRDLLEFEFDVLSDTKKYPEPFFLMTDTLGHLNKYYDYILIDTPPSLGLMNGNVFTFADYVIIPSSPELFAYRSLIEVLDTIYMFKNKQNPALEVIGILPTLVKSRSNLHSQVIQETNKLASERGVPVFDTAITETVQFTNAILHSGVPATLLPEKKRDKANLYYDLWNEIQPAIEEVTI